MNLNNFEDFTDINNTIKGRDYSENNLVHLIKNKSNHSFKAEVSKTYTYEVQIELEEDLSIISSKCNCCSLESYCKHIIAVFFKLRDILLDNYIECTKKEKIPCNKYTNNIRQLLSELNKNELIDFLISLTCQYEEINSRIKLEFSKGNEKDELKLCRELIDIHIRQSSDKNGFVSYFQSFEVVKGIRIVLEKARTTSINGRYYHAIEITLCTIHEIMKLLQHSDDSGGIIIDLLHESFDFMEDIIVAGRNISSDEREKLFYKLMEEASNKRYDNCFEYRLILMEYCIYMAISPKLRSLLENKLESLLEYKDNISLCTNYIKEHVLLLMYKMIAKYESKYDSEDFLQKNLHHASFRRIAINNAFKNRNYSLVIRLALQGEELDKKRVGLMWQWKIFRYDAYKLSGQLEEQRKLAIDFILDGDFKYYSELKSTYSEKDWQNIYPTIISFMEKKDRTFVNSYTNILIEERELKKLLDYVKSNPSTLELFYSHLIPDFKEEAYSIFQSYIEDIANKAVSRKDYHTVCNMIKKLGLMFENEDIKKIIKVLLTKYYKKAEFKDELLKIQISL